MRTGRLEQRAREVGVGMRAESVGEVGGMRISEGRLHPVGREWTQHGTNLPGKTLGSISSTDLVGDHPRVRAPFLAPQAPLDPRVGARWLYELLQHHNLPTSSRGRLYREFADLLRVQYGQLIPAPHVRGRRPAAAAAATTATRVPRTHDPGGDLVQVSLTRIRNGSPQGLRRCLPTQRRIMEGAST